LPRSEHRGATMPYRKKELAKRSGKKRGGDTHQKKGNTKQQKAHVGPPATRRVSETATATYFSWERSQKKEGRGRRGFKTSGRGRPYTCEAYSMAPRQGEATKN